MLKTVFMLAFVLGMCACAPLLETKDSAIPLESVLLIPETELLTNSSIVLEDIPKMQKLVEDLQETTETTEIEQTETTLESLESRDLVLIKNMDKLEKDIQKKVKSLEDNEFKILEEVRESAKIKETEILDEKKAETMVDEIRHVMNVSENRILTDKHVNMTIKLELEDEFLPLEDRAFLVASRLNETERVEILLEETKLIKLNKTLTEMDEKTRVLAEDVEDRNEINKQMKKLIKMKESKFMKMMNASKVLKTEIMETESELKSEEKEVKKESKEESGELKEEFEEKKVKKEDSEEEKEEKKESSEEEKKEKKESSEEEKGEKRSFNSQDEIRIPMETAPSTTQRYTKTAPVIVQVPVTTKAYTTVTSPMIEEPVTTEAYHTTDTPTMIEEPVTTVAYKKRDDEDEKRSYNHQEEIPMIEEPVTTEAYHTVVPPMIEVPVTTEAYHTVVPPMIEVPVTTVAYKKRQEEEEEDHSEEEMEEKRFDHSQDSISMEVEPEHKERQVREILDKITVYFQLKNQGILDFVSTSYCKTDTKKFQYYKIHPTDPAKYVECNPWGKGTIKSCIEGRLWDQFHEMCSTPQFLNMSKNLTAEFQKSEKLEKMYSGLNCNNSDYKCINKGECIQFEDGYKCECTKEFTGEFCEYKVVENSVFTEILTDKFNFTKFRDELAANTTSFITTEEMTNMKTLLKISTHEEIMEYLNRFDKHQVRYDIVMNALIEDILEDIYPDAYYMSVFNATAHRLVDVVRTVPSLISYSKYENERYSEVFSKYQDVLDKTVSTLNETWSGVDLESIEYIKITGHILNETGIMNNIFKSASKVSQQEIATRLEVAFNKTVEQTMQHTLELTGLRLELIKEMVNRPEIINMRLGELEAEFKSVRELVRIFDGVRRDSIEVIASLFSYGFWYATDCFAEHF